MRATLEPTAHQSHGCLSQINLQCIVFFSVILTRRLENALYRIS
jgi:hypothetical protein